jgi:hypothetical protein
MLGAASVWYRCVTLQVMFCFGAMDNVSLRLPMVSDRLVKQGVDISYLNY